MKTLQLIGAAALAVLLAGCGGGGGGNDAPPPPPTEAVPDSASASSAGMTGWLTQVAATAPEDKEALDAGRFAPPQPDDTEPVALP